MAILRYILFCAGVFVALKHGFRSLDTLKLVMSVVGKLETEKNSCSIQWRRQDLRTGKACSWA